MAVHLSHCLYDIIYQAYLVCENDIHTHTGCQDILNNKGVELCETLKLQFVEEQDGAQSLCVSVLTWATGGGARAKTISEHQKWYSLKAHYKENNQSLEL